MDGLAPLSSSSSVVGAFLGSNVVACVRASQLFGEEEFCGMFKILSSNRNCLFKFSREASIARKTASENECENARQWSEEHCLLPDYLILLGCVHQIPP